MKSSKDIIDNVIRLYEAGDITSILNNSNELLTKFPNNATIHNILGAVFSQFNDFEKSIYHLQKAITIDPDNYLILNNLGNISFARRIPITSSLSLPKTGYLECPESIIFCIILFVSSLI